MVCIASDYRIIPLEEGNGIGKEVLLFQTKLVLFKLITLRTSQREPFEMACKLTLSKKRKLFNQHEFKVAPYSINSIYI